MTPTDEAELRRLTEMLREISETLPKKSPLIEALKKSALALSTAFMDGRRSEIEHSYGNLGAELTEEQKDNLRRMGIDLDAPGPA